MDEQCSAVLGMAQVIAQVIAQVMPPGMAQVIAQAVAVLPPCRACALPWRHR